MIKFEEHDGKLFRMLEKPVPCQSQLKWNYIAGIVNDKPLLIRDIPKIVNPRISITTLNDLSKVEYVVQYYMPLEIIGTFVEEGSAEWALYQMMKGDKVTKGHLEHTYWHYDARTHLQCISEYICGTLQIMVSPEIWIKTADKDGWQIYEESKPKFVAGSYVKINYANSDDEHYVVKESSVLDAIEISRLSDGKTEWFYEAGYDFIIPIPASEVILDFGNGIVGWIAHNGKHNIDVFSKDNCWLACLAVSMLTEPMKSTVLELLKAQEEEYEKR